MKNDLKSYRRRLEKFNRWEAVNIRSKSSSALLDEFSILFSLAGQLPADVIEKSRQMHLNNLIAMQERIRIRLKEKGKRVRGKRINKK
jgi:hypothetical protein